MEPSEILTKAADLIESKGFCKQAYSIDENGKEVDYLSDKAVAFCSIGAIETVSYPSTLDDTGNAYIAINRVIFPTGLSLEDWNDDPDRTKDEVVEAFRKAALLA